jgi:hypothetical protein
MVLPLAGIDLHALGLMICPQIRLHRIHGVCRAEEVTAIHLRRPAGVRKVGSDPQARGEAIGNRQ